MTDGRKLPRKELPGMPILCCTIFFLVRTYYSCRPGDGFIGFSKPTHLMQKSVLGDLLTTY